MTTRTIETWKRIGEENADTDRRRNVRAGRTADEVRHALAYHHCDDLDSAEITEQTHEGREAAIDAMVAGYLSTFPLASGEIDPTGLAVEFAGWERRTREFPDLTFRGAADRIAGYCVVKGIVFSVGGVAEKQAVAAYRAAWDAVHEKPYAWRA